MIISNCCRNRTQRFGPLSRFSSASPGDGEWNGKNKSRRGGGEERTGGERWDSQMAPGSVKATGKRARVKAPLVAHGNRRGRRVAGWPVLEEHALPHGASEVRGQRWTRHLSSTVDGEAKHETKRCTVLDLYGMASSCVYITPTTAKKN